MSNPNARLDILEKNFETLLAGLKQTASHNVLDQSVKGYAFAPLIDAITEIENEQSNTG